MSHSTTRARAQANQSPRRSSASKTKPATTKPATRDAEHDFERLENVVRVLVEAHQKALVRNEALGSDLDEKNQHIRQLETKILDVNQRRQDVAKRIEELIAQIDQLDAQLAESATDLS